MNSADKVSNLINSLTSDEDQRQDLWVYYLSGHSSESLSSYVNDLKLETKLERDIQAYLWYVFKNPPSDNFMKLLEQLSDVEKSIVCLLALGLTVSQLSEYKGMSEIRIRQVISVLRDNHCWEQLYAEEKTNRRRTLRS